jgi:predicted membrane protein
VPLRRIFLLGAATVVSLAALVAISAILNGDFGETEGKIFATLAASFVAGSSAIAGIACLERGVSRPLGIVGVVLAVGGFVLWAEQIWAEHQSDAYWKLLGLVLIWTVATAMITTTRLMTRSAHLVRTLFPATVAATVAAAVVITVMVLRQEGDGWQLFAVLLILAVLGEILTPILQRYAATPVDAAAPAERLLGVSRGVAVVAVRTGSPRRVVYLGDRELPFEDDEAIVVRPA